MDFGNPKELKFFNDLRPNPGSQAFGRGGGGGGGHIVRDFVTHVMRPQYLLKKSDRRCALTHLAKKNMIPLDLQSALLSNKSEKNV